jgi:hypothetical protein
MAGGRCSIPSSSRPVPREPIRLDAAMAVQQFLLTPDVFRQPGPQLLVVSSHENEIATVLDCFLGSVTDASVGIAGAYDKCALTCLALASSSRVLLVRFVKPSKKKSKLCKGKEQPLVAPIPPSRALLTRKILCAAGTRKFGLHLDRLVTSLFLDLDLRMADGVDIIALAPPKKALQSTLDGIVGALGGWGALGERQRVVKVTTDERFDVGDLSSLAVRAWACLQRGTVAATAKLLATSLRHNTVPFLRQVSPYSLNGGVCAHAHGAQELAVLSKIRRHQDKLDALKPTRVRNDIGGHDISQKTGNLMLDQTRFKTRMRVSTSQVSCVILFLIYLMLKLSSTSLSNPPRTAKMVLASRPKGVPSKYAARRRLFSCVELFHMVASRSLQSERRSPPRLSLSVPTLYTKRCRRPALFSSKNSSVRSGYRSRQQQRSGRRQPLR